MLLSVGCRPATSRRRCALCFRAPARKLLRRVGVDLTLRGEVGLAADEQLVHARRVPINLVQPRLHVLERLAVRGVVHHDDAVRAAIVAARDRAEALLPAVSQICSLMVLPSSWIVRILKSTPIVEMWLSV